MKEIMSLQNPLVKHLVKLRQNSDYRYDHHAIVIEGLKMVSEASLTLKFKTLLTTSPDLIPPDVKADEVILTSPDILKKISGLQSPEGILAEVSMPKQADFKNKKRLLALDGINDPGNLGTILRTALALGWEGVFFLDEGCDPFNEKALRASRGAIFRLPMVRGSWKDLKHLVEQNQLTALVADTIGTSFDEIKPSQGIVLVMSNEAAGPSPQSLSICTPITIPMPGNMESLNVAIAAGILLYALKGSP